MVVHLMKIVILVWDYVLVTLVNFCMLLLLLLYDLESDKLCLRVANIGYLPDVNGRVPT